MITSTSWLANRLLSVLAALALAKSGYTKTMIRIQVFASLPVAIAHISAALLNVRIIKIADTISSLIDNNII